jgi:hypothetical protein
VNTMFYFRINASIVAFLSNHISFGILMTTFFKICFKSLKKPQVLHRLPSLFITHYTIYILSAMLLLCVLSRVVYANNVPPQHGVEHCQRNAGSLIDDVRRDIAINFMHYYIMHWSNFGREYWREQLTLFPAFLYKRPESCSAYRLGYSVPRKALP